jgi:hypothetical protein
MSIIISRKQANELAAEAVRISKLPEDSPEVQGLISVVATAEVVARGCSQVPAGLGDEGDEGLTCPMVQCGLWRDGNPSGSTFDMAMAWDQATADFIGHYSIRIDPLT